MSEKLAKLALMLSSDQPGEVVAAARAIGRELKSMGRDWHWLAGRLLGEVPQPRPAPRPDYGPSARTYGVYTISELRAMAESLTHPDVILELASKESEFVWVTLARLRRYGDRTFFSPKQRKYLVDLWEEHVNKEGRE